jgi:hypothetical protein
LLEPDSFPALAETIGFVEIISRYEVASFVNKPVSISFPNVSETLIEAPNFSVLGASRLDASSFETGRDLEDPGGLNVAPQGSHPRCV